MAALRAYSWICTQSSLPEALRGPYGVPGSKASTLPAVPSLLSLSRGPLILAKVPKNPWAQYRVGRGRKVTQEEEDLSHPEKLFPQPGGRIRKCSRCFSPCPALHTGWRGRKERARNCSERNSAAINILKQGTVTLSPARPYQEPWEERACAQFSGDSSCPSGHHGWRHRMNWKDPWGLCSQKRQLRRGDKGTTRGGGTGCTHRHTYANMHTRVYIDM